MSNEPEIKPAVRTRVKPLLGFFGKSGGGKTRTALEVARGMVGPKGRIVLIDSESGRGSLFADVVTGGYSIIDIEPPFSPATYTAAFQKAEANADIVLTDSMSHLWDGEGGILEMQDAELTRMAGDDYRKREGCKMAAWIKPKAEFKRFIQGCMLRSKIPIICCLRGQEKTIIDRKDGKTTVRTTEESYPIFDHRFIFELLLCGEVISINGEGGYFRPTKVTHPAIKAMLPGPNEQMGQAFGQRLAEWCRGGAVAPASKPEPARATSAAPTIKAVKNEIWQLTEKVHGGDPAKLEQHFWDEGYLPDSKRMADLTLPELQTALDKIKKAK